SEVIAYPAESWIRKADEAWGEAALDHGLADPRFCRMRSAEPNRVARFREGEPAGEPLCRPARTEPRPPRTTQDDLANRIPSLLGSPPSPAIREPRCALRSDDTEASSGYGQRLSDRFRKHGSPGRHARRARHR